MVNEFQEAAIPVPDQQSETKPTSSKAHPVVLGEVLFDCFPDGKRVLGGAPFNVAWNLRGMGLDPIFLSARSDDQAGQEIQQRCDSWGLDQSGIQVVKNKPTGQVTVSFENGEPAYSIEPEQAYDYVDVAEISQTLAARIATASVFYHGSLAWRHSVSRRSIQAIRQQCQPITFIDLNIRRPWFDIEWLPQLLTNVRWLKLNVNELNEIGSVHVDQSSDCDQIVKAVAALKDEYSFSEALVTAGSRGAFAVDQENKCWFAASPNVPDLVDTVGAGDAFSSMAIAQLTAGRSPDEVLQASVEFAVAACKIKGATTNAAGHYPQLSLADSNHHNTN